MSDAIEALRALVAPPEREWLAFMASHGRSFRFAARFMAPDDADRVAAVYAFCRFTDDLVDRAESPGLALVRLDAWCTLTGLAHRGLHTGVPLLDRVMGDARRAGVPLHYATELIAGVRMDLERVHFSTLDALGLYTHRVASTVGLWLTELFGVRDAWVLARAARLGHAMQITNILRDVGEDLAHGRVYLPADLMAAHGVTTDDLEAWRAGAVPNGSWRALVDTLVAEADAAYDDAREAIPALPAGFRRATAVAARVYRGIHDEIRRADYDTLRRRVWVRPHRKVALAARALFELASIGATPALGAVVRR